MLTFPVRNLFIEGPDCSGKTSLVRDIHKKTNYQYHIHDRSQISRSIFAKMYERHLPYLKSDMHFEISDLNNRFVFLLPDPEVIEKRFKIRGDEIHDFASIMNVWTKFAEATEEFSSYPNVFISHSDSVERISDNLIPYIYLQERQSLLEISEYAKKFVSATKNNESYPLQFTLFDDGEFEEASIESMNYGPEKEYYEKIYTSMHNKISRELNGENEYSRKESFSSRRFVYTDDSCISFIQFAIREELMDFNVVIRSSDIENTFEHDLKFLYYLASQCYYRFKDNCNQVRIRFNLNSAHFVR